MHWFGSRFLGKVNPFVRFLTALTLGAAGYFLIPGLVFELRFLLAYDLLVVTYLVLLAARLLRTDADCASIFPIGTEPAGWAALGAAFLVSAFGMVAVGALVENDPGWPRWQHQMRLSLSLVGVFLSWMLLHVGFASHYARLCFQELPSGEGSARRQGLAIPNKEVGDYWDFLYFSFTIAMCYQTSDVSVTDETMRRVTLLHALLSFFYVAVVFGLVVNVISNIV